LEETGSHFCPFSVFQAGPAGRGFQLNDQPVRLDELFPEITECLESLGIENFGALEEDEQNT
jgi:hypothetical protein